MAEVTCGLSKDLTSLVMPYETKDELMSFNYYTNHCTYIKFIKFYTFKHLKALRNVSVLRPSSGSYNFLAKVTLEIVAY